KVRADFGQKHPMIIGGQEVWSKTMFPDTSPADTRLVLGLFPKGGRPHAKQAVNAAKGAFPRWSATASADRVRLVQRAADLISQGKFALAALMSFENGKNRYEAMADVDEAADLMRWYAAEMLRNQGYERPMGTFLPGETTRSILKPYGVWAVVAPFNFPLAIAAGMTTGALITGNTVVFKPASDTPFMGLRLAETLRDAGLPAGAFNFVTGPDPTARDVYLGPVINEAAVATFENAIAEIKRSKGTVIAGGKTLKGNGHFVEPTIVDALPRDHRINKEELFVPILSIVPVDDLED